MIGVILESLEASLVADPAPSRWFTNVGQHFTIEIVGNLGTLVGAAKDTRIVPGNALYYALVDVNDGC